MIVLFNFGLTVIAITVAVFSVFSVIKDREQDKRLDRLERALVEKRGP